MFCVVEEQRDLRALTFAYSQWLSLIIIYQTDEWLSY